MERRGEESQKMGILGALESSAHFLSRTALTEAGGSQPCTAAPQEFLCTPIFLNTTSEALWTRSLLGKRSPILSFIIFVTLIRSSFL